MRTRAELLLYIHLIFACWVLRICLHSEQELMNTYLNDAILFIEHQHDLHIIY